MNKGKNKVDELRDVLTKKKAAQGQAKAAPPAEEGKADDHRDVTVEGGGDIKDATPSVAEAVAADVGKASELAALMENLRAAEEEAKAHYDKLLRVMAELDNFKKRTEREKAELVKFSNENLIRDLLPLLDVIDNITSHTPPDCQGELKSFFQGVELLGREFRRILERYGVEEIKIGGGLFDPTFHEAVAYIESDSVEKDHIIEVHRKGYTLHGRVIRAAMVTVSKGKGEANRA